MKLFHVVILLFVALLSNGCINVDVEQCVDEEKGNLTLLFNYEINNQKEVFIEKIQKVDIFVFKKEGQYVTTRSMNLDALSNFTGITLELDPGSYQVVCWGNVSEKSFTTPLGSQSLFKDALISHVAKRNGTAATDGDSLYYASDKDLLFEGLNATVSTKNTTERTISFYNAYVKVQVYVKGLIDKNSQGELLPPTIEMTNVPDGYNFDMQTNIGLISYLNKTSFQPIGGEEVAVLTFYTPRFKDDNPIEILVKKSSDNSVITRINLKNFMQENNITVEDIPEAMIPLLIEYKEVSVEISVPKWVQDPVDPEL